MCTAIKLYDIYGIFTLLYSFQNDSLQINVKMRTALKFYHIYGILTFLYSLAERFFTDTRKDAYSTETFSTYTASLRFYTA